MDNLNEPNSEEKINSVTPAAKPRTTRAAAAKPTVTPPTSVRKPRAVKPVAATPVQPEQEVVEMVSVTFVDEKAPTDFLLGGLFSKKKLKKLKNKLTDDKKKEKSKKIKAKEKAKKGKKKAKNKAKKHKAKAKKIAKKKVAAKKKSLAKKKKK